MAGNWEGKVILHELFKWLLSFLKGKNKTQTVYQELREAVREKPKYRARNRRERRMLAHIQRPKRGVVKAKLRQEHLARLRTPRQRVLARMSNNHVACWQRTGRDEAHLDYLAKEWGIK